MTAGSEAQLWANKEQRKEWQSAAGCRQATMFTDRTDKQLPCLVLGRDKTVPEPLSAFTSTISYCLVMA